jgi:hypothetical protein
MKQQMEAQQKKFNLEKREFENLRKKQKEQYDKFKEEENKKMADQKRILEQRQRNINLATQSSKKDRDEIEALRKQLLDLKNEQNQKDKFNKS